MIGTNQFREAIKSIGLIPPDSIEPGKLHRFPGAGKRNGNTAAWCKLFPDGIGGVYGDHSQDISAHWQAERSAPFTQAQREAFFRKVQESKEQAEADKQAKQSEAATKAAAIWQAAQPATDDHPYLARKGILAHGAKLHNGALVIPMREGAALHSLQFIGGDGTKRFLTDGRKKGCYFSIGTPKGATALCIAEGFATGATIHQATGLPVAVAFDAGNLEAVAVALRARLADLSLILCADDDAGTEGNPGVTKATAAAQTVGGKLAIPDFGENRPEGASDFNDLAAHCGKEAVQRAIAGAIDIPGRCLSQPTENNASKLDVGAWPDPQPMTAKVSAEPYPFDALPETIRAAVAEVQGFTKAPIAMVASSALAALSLASQSHVDVKRAEKLSGPTSLFLLTIADSGERKSTCDGIFSKAIRDYEAQQAEAAKPRLTDHRAAVQSWESKRGGIKDKIRMLAKQGSETTAKEAELRALGDAPEPPRVPKLIYGDATPEALKWNLAKLWPSGGVVSAEGGIVFGSHGMNKESIMRNLATLNELWDGKPISTERRTSESFTVRGARLTMGIQVQAATLRSFFDRSGGLARGTGFLARFLSSWPESTQGFRPFTDPPESWPALAAFNRRIAAILEQPVTIDDDGALSPSMLSLTPEAKAAWVKFHDEIEAMLKPGGELHEVQDVASKSADNAVRMAALFQVFEHDSGGTVGVQAFEGASQIAAWHLNEARRFFGELALPVELANAARLDHWLIEYCMRERTHLVGKNHTRQHGPLRDGAALDTAIRELANLDRMRLVKEGKRQTIHINPALIAEGAAS